MNAYIITVVTTITSILSLLIIADALLSFILSPFHPVREAMGRVLQPIYAPIRRILPSTGMIDFTPLVVLVMLRVLEALIINILT